MDGRGSTANSSWLGRSPQLLASERALPACLTDSINNKHDYYTATDLEVHSRTYTRAQVSRRSAHTAVAHRSAKTYYSAARPPAACIEWTTFSDD